MCKLDNKNNRKMCVFKKRPIFPHSLLHYKVDIFSFLSLILISNYSTSERFLKIELVGLVKFFSPYPLRGKNIFLKKYLSNILALMTIERFLKRRSLSPQVHSLSIKG